MSYSRCVVRKRKEKLMNKIEKPGYHKNEVKEPLILEKDDYINEPDKWDTIKSICGFSSKYYVE